MAEQKMDETLREIFRAAYQYRKKYQHPTRSDQFWRNAAQEMTLRVQELGNHPFAHDVFMACYADIRRECLEREPASVQMKIL
ncbi:hypothetical protein LJC33_00555 [Eubacteriales bacterium OttesenSCG-928-N13]|nr:hypothetical protein [Eubacteriales bacterium OttesenSCG-928-N13]